MEPEDIVFRVAYMVLILTLALMTWAVTVQASEYGRTESPCSFDLLCSCSKMGPDFGIVNCHSVPFANPPTALNSSRAFILSMQRNGMEVLEPKQLSGTMLWRLEIKDNMIYHIDDNAFFGLTKSLAELDLQNNQLTDIPNTPLRLLAKLRVLNLNGNKIVDVSGDDWDGLSTSLACLGLANNWISSIPEDAFEGLLNLEQLDLTGNSLQLIHPQAFVGISRSLNRLFLAHNLLHKIPFEALSALKLQVLDLSQNYISSTFDSLHPGKLYVEEHLNLSMNQVHTLVAKSFQSFYLATSVSLSYNPIIAIEDGAFQGANTQQLDLSHNYIQGVYPAAFRGLERSLIGLDLGFNNLTYLPPDLFAGFVALQELVLDENAVSVTKESLLQLASLNRLSIIGNKVLFAPFEELSALNSLRELNVSNIPSGSLTPQLFAGFGTSLQHLKISYANVNSVSNLAFGHLTGLKSLDLSENKIMRLEEGAFSGVGHSLQVLRLSNALRMNSIIPSVLHKLTNVQELDLSSNALTTMDYTSFIHCAKLTHLNLRFNKLSSVHPKLFEAGNNPQLQHLSLSFNQIKELKATTFSKLKQLKQLELNDNSITTIHPRAFQDLTSIRLIDLAGNRISHLENGVFQNLPTIQLLDLSRNELSTLNLDAFEQLGTLASWHLDLSYNRIAILGALDLSHTQIFNMSSNLPPADHLDERNTPSASSSSIESINLSHNNISFIAPNFFFPISNSLLELKLSHNQMNNFTRQHLGSMPYLVSLAVDNNFIDTLDYDTFKDSPRLQVISLNHNLIRELPPDLFEHCPHLRVFSATNNKIRSLADTLFNDTFLEILDMAENQLVRFPEAAVARIAATLVKLDLSENEISSISGGQVECMQNLRWLSLSNNRIVVISELTFDPLRALLVLHLSGNPMGRISARLFEKCRTTLVHLNLANMSLETLPEFDTFPQLLTFNASFNSLTFLPTNFGVNVSNIRTLDIAGNELSTSPNTIWHTIPRLSSVYLYANPIISLSNDSFLQLEHLHHLDISDIPLDSLQVGMLTPIQSLRSLKLGPIESIVGSPGAVIQSVDSLQHLQLIEETPSLSNELRYFPLPHKLSKLTLSGPTLLNIENGAFEGVQSRSFHLVLENTGIMELEEGVVQRMGKATDITLEFGQGPLKIIGNPNRRFRPQPFVTYLQRLKIREGSSLSCTCNSGWMEFWLRNFMSKTCPVSPINSPPTTCSPFLRSLRAVRCENKVNINLVQAFVTELECGWESGASQNLLPFLLIVSSLSVLFLLVS